MDSNNTNTVRYELYLSKTPNESHVEYFRKFLRPIWKDIPDEFDLKVDKQQRKCYGSHDVNQKIEREWLIIYALYQLSLFDCDLVITVQDTDGQILLITAAEVIPGWLESRKSKNRVFIHKGKLHIIPEEVNLKDLKKRYASNTIPQAAACFVRDMNRTPAPESNQHEGMTIKTQADRPIQAAIEEQLVGMPDQKAWLSKKFTQLDEILSGQNGMDDTEELQKRFSGDVSLASLMAMDDEDLRISPISSRSSSMERSSSSSVWLTEQEDE